jgi:hypothetical protein
LEIFFNFLIRGGTHRLGICQLLPSDRPKQFFETSRPTRIEPATSHTHASSSTTTHLFHLYLYSISVTQILYQIKCKLIIWGPKWIQIKKLSTTKCHNSCQAKRLQINFLSIHNNKEVKF